ncbi:MAG: MATE family efflux transporter [Rikenellaceae bacterium]
MYKFSKYKEQYRENLRLAIPVMLSQVGHIIVQIADNAMVGQYGGDDPTPLAAAAFGGGLFFIMMVTIMGLTFGITPLVGGLYAQGDRVKSAKYLQNSILLFGIIAVAATAIQYCTIPIMWHMGQPDEVVRLAIPYYQTLIWSMIPQVGFFVFKQFLEGIGNTKIAMYSVVVSNVINIVLNYLLIGGEMGAPEMGVLGAGVATLTSRVSMAVIIIAYFLYNRHFTQYRELFARCNFSKIYIRRLLNMGFPISMQVMLEAGSFIVIGFLFGAFGASAISAQQISLTIANCSFMIIVALGSSTTIRVSHSYGLRDFKQMRLASKAGWQLALLWNVLAAIFLFIFRTQIPQIFTSNSEVIELASILIMTVIAYQIADGVQCIGIGILRGMQDVKRIPFIAFVSYWIFNIPVGYFCAYHLGMGAKGLYMGFFSGFILACSLIIWRIKYRQKQLRLSFEG